MRFSTTSGASCGWSGAKITSMATRLTPRRPGQAAFTGTAPAATTARTTGDDHRRPRLTARRMLVAARAIHRVKEWLARQEAPQVLHEELGDHAVPLRVQRRRYAAAP